MISWDQFVNENINSSTVYRSIDSLFGMILSSIIGDHGIE